jgi:hypothetical protein
VAELSKPDVNNLLPGISFLFASQFFYVRSRVFNEFFHFQENIETAIALAEKAPLIYRDATLHSNPSNFCRSREPDESIDLRSSLSIGLAVFDLLGKEMATSHLLNK